jgi:hypothetical protein
MNEKTNSHSDASHGQTQSPSTLYRRILEVSGLDKTRMSHAERMYIVAKQSDRSGISPAF